MLYHRTLGQSLSLSQSRSHSQPASNACSRLRGFLVSMLRVSLCSQLHQLSAAKSDDRSWRPDRVERQNTTKLSTNEELQKMLHRYCIDTAMCTAIPNGDASESNDCLQNMKCTRLFCLASMTGITCLKQIEKTSMIKQCFQEM